MTSPGGADAPDAVEVLGRLGPDEGPALFVLYTGGTFGMGVDDDGSLVPLDLRELGVHLPFLRRLPLGLTVATFVDPIDSSAMNTSDWIDIADAIVAHAPGHAGVVVLHGTDTMAYTASALSFLLEGIDIPIVLTGAQRPVTGLRSDGRENLVTALAIAAGHLRGGPIVPEVTIFFSDVLLRGNRAVKVHADSYHGFASPNHPPLATAGVSIDFESALIRAAGAGPMRRSGGISAAVTGLRLHPGMDGHGLEAVLARPGLRGVVLEAYGAGNGPPDSWFLEPLRAAVDRGVVVVITTQCRAGGVVGGLYATGSALLATGAVSGGDMTFEAALTKLMTLTERHPPDDVRQLMQQDLAGERPSDQPVTHRVSWSGMAELREVYESLDLALRIGEIQLSSGAGAADVTASMLAVTHACGLRNVSADVTFADLTLHHQASLDEAPAILVRRVTRRQVDYADLTEVDQTVTALIGGEISREEARDQVARTVSTGHQRQRWLVTLAWGVMGTGIALTLDGSPLVCLLAFVAACAIDRTRRVMSRLRLPSFYLQAAGGFVATLIAVAAAATPLEVNPSRVVTAGIVMLLAGIGLMGGTQDAMTGFPVTASARLLEAMLETAGIIAGVAAGLTFGDLLGVGLGNFKPGAAGLAAAGVTVLGAVIAAAGFAFASYAPLRALLAVGLVAALGQAVVLGVDSADVGQVWGPAAGAVTIGAVCYLVAGRFRVPPLVVVVPAIVPLLPGLDIYRGLALLAEGKDGVLPLAAALGTAIALAAGVILGQYLAQPLRREARRLETRLSGPRMVGPFRRSEASDS